MADIKTNLRELSVGFYFYGGHIQPVTPNDFLEVCTRNIVGCFGLSLNNIASNVQRFDDEEISIVENGLKLARVIEQTFNVLPQPRIRWSGFETHSGSPVDLSIGDLRFSLKEHSFILENMGLYRLLNLVMDEEKYDRGLHVFEEFAYPELCLWFETTKSLLLEYGPLPYHYRGEGYTSTATLDHSGTLRMRYQARGTEEVSDLEDFEHCDYRRFEQSTNSFTRYRVFSKWLKDNVESHVEYVKTKRACAVEAGRKIERLLTPYIGTSPRSFLNLYRSEQYYYAKTSGRGVRIYDVPRSDGGRVPLVIRSIKSSVPAHQLNILTVIENTNSHETVAFRNELRYSHGQFNGTPEAKFYVKGEDMTALYERLYPR